MEVRRILESGDRETAIRCLPTIYDALILLNGRDKSDWQNLWSWNPSGRLTQEEFKRLNRGRMVLSNDIGIMTASGVIRYNLNKIED